MKQLLKTLLLSAINNACKIDVQKTLLCPHVHLAVTPSTVVDSFVLDSPFAGLAVASGNHLQYETI